MNRRRPVFICMEETSGEQCSYVPYTSAQAAYEAGTPTHVHHDENGAFKERAWGPADKCTKVTSNG